MMLFPPPHRPPKEEKEKEEKKGERGKATTFEPRLLFTGVFWMCLFMNH